MFDKAKLLKEVVGQLKINQRGDHGPSHWARVLHHGLVIGERVGADLEVVKLFAFLHDSQRHNEYRDPNHGRRAAQYAQTLNHVLFEVSEAQMALLVEAMEGHSEGAVHSDPTIQTCWDADRLDLGRVGIKPEPEFLSLEGQRWIEFAYEWSVSGVMPKESQIKN